MMKGFMGKTSLSVKEIWNFKKSIWEIYQVKDNAFDVLRFIMASLVVVHHSYALLRIADPNLFIQSTAGQIV